MPLAKKRLSLKDFLNPDHAAIDIAATPIFSARGTDAIGAVLSESSWRSGRVIVRDSKGGFLGMLTSRDILDFLGGGPKARHFRESGLKTRVSRIMDSNVHHLERDQAAHEALDFFRKHGRDAHPITDGGKIAGLLSETDFIRNIDRPMGVLVSDVMTRKPFTISEGTSISEAARHLSRGAFRRIPVVSQGSVSGIVSPHDMLASMESHDPREVMGNESSVRTVMNRAVISTKPGRDVHDAVKTMKRARLGFLPVIEDRRLVGIITERDILEI